MENVIAVLILVVVIGGAATYLVNAKKKWCEMCRMPGRGKLLPQTKKEKEEIERQDNCKEEDFYLRNALSALCG